MSGNARRAPSASWEPESGQWLDADGMSSDLFGQLEPFLGRWPTSGMTRSGSLFPLPTPVLPTGGNGSSSSGGLLPTPSASQYECQPEVFLPRRERQKALGRNGNGFGLTTAMAVALLRTPTAQLATNGGSQHPDKRREGGHGPTLADEVEHLLPTPRPQTKGGGASADPPSRVRSPENPDGHSPNLMTVVSTLLPTPDATHGRKTSRTGPLLAGAVESLLPTPTAADGDRTSDTFPRGSLTLKGALLPTPNASDGKGSSGSQSRPRRGRPRPVTDIDLPEAVSLLPTPTGTNSHGNDQRNDGTLLLPGVVKALLPTPSAAIATGGQTSRSGDRKDERLLSGIAREMTTSLDADTLLPTPTAGDSKASGSRNLPGSNAHQGTSLTDAMVTGDSRTPRRPAGDRTNQPSAAGSPSSDGQLPGQLTLDELASD